MRYFVATILFSLFLSLFLGTLADGDSPLITVEDALGRQVEVPSPAQRIVTVSAATHEFIRLLGCADRLVGAGQYVQGHASDLFPEVQRLPSVGHGFTPNMEILAKLRPDLIIAWAANPGPDLERSLAPLGVKVLRLNFSRTDTIKREVAVLAEALGQDARPLAQKYLTWVGGLEEELLAKVNQSPKRPSVLIEQLTEFAIAGQLSSAGVLAKTLGATNAGERFPGQFGSVSNEWILRQNPDYFIKMFAWRNQEDATKLLTMKKQVVESIANRPGWSSLQAVKKQRIRVLESDYSGGPRYIVGLYKMASWLYPELVDQDKWLEVEKEYFKLFHNDYTNKILTDNKSPKTD